MTKCADQPEVEFERKRRIKDEPPIFATRIELPATNWEMERLKGGRFASKIGLHCVYSTHEMLSRPLGYSGLEVTGGLWLEAE